MEGEEEEDAESSSGENGAKEQGICFADFLKLSEKALQKGLRDGTLTGSGSSGKNNSGLNDSCDGSSTMSPSKRLQSAALIESPSMSSMQQQRCVWEDSIPSLLCRRCFQFDCIAHQKSQINGDGGEQCMLHVNDATLKRAKESVPPRRIGWIGDRSGYDGRVYLRGVRVSRRKREVRRLSRYPL